MLTRSVSSSEQVQLSGTDDNQSSQLSAISSNIANHYQVKAIQAKRALALASLLKGEGQDLTLTRLESKVKKLSLELVRVRRVARSNMLRPVSCILLGEASLLPAQAVIEELEYLKTNALQMVFTRFIYLYNQILCLSYTVIDDIAQIVERKVDIEEEVNCDGSFGLQAEDELRQRLIDAAEQDWKAKLAEERERRLKAAAASGAVVLRRKRSKRVSNPNKADHNTISAPSEAAKASNADIKFDVGEEADEEWDGLDEASEEDTEEYLNDDEEEEEVNDDEGNPDDTSHQSREEYLVPSSSDPANQMNAEVDLSGIAKINLSTLQSPVSPTRRSAGQSGKRSILKPVATTHHQRAPKMLEILQEAQRYIQIGNIDGAESCLDRASAHDPADILTCTMRANFLYKLRDDFAEAGNIFSASLRLCLPTFHSKLEGLSTDEWSSKSLTGQHCVVHSIERDYTVRDIVYLLISYAEFLHTQTQDTSTEEMLLSKCLQVCPDNSLALNRLAQLTTLTNKSELS